MPTKRKAPEAEVSEPLETKKPSRNLEVLFSWVSPDRIWQPKDRAWYLFYAGLVSVLIIVSVKLGYPILVLGLIAFLFMWFVQGSIPPLMLTHKITNAGLLSGDIMHRWADTSYFWFATKGEYVLLYLDAITEKRVQRSTILIPPKDMEQIFDLVVDKVKYATEDEAGYNFIAQPLYGKFVPVAHFIEDLDQPTA